MQAPYVLASEIHTRLGIQGNPPNVQFASIHRKCGFPPKMYWTQRRLCNSHELDVMCPLCECNWALGIVYKVRHWDVDLHSPKGWLRHLNIHHSHTMADLDIWTWTYYELLLADLDIWTWRLTFMWWGCYGLCHRHKLTKLAHSFLFCSCVCFCLYGPFNSISLHKFSRQLFAFLALFFWS